MSFLTLFSVFYWSLTALILVFGFERASDIQTLLGVRKLKRSRSENFNFQI